MQGHVPLIQVQHVPRHHLPPCSTALVISAHTPEYLCPNLGYFSLMFANPGLFIVTRHTVLSHSQPLSVIAHKHTLALCQSKWHYIAVIPDCVTLKPQFVCWLPDPSLNFHTHPTSPVPVLVRTWTNTVFFYYCGKFEDTTQCPPNPPPPPGSSHPRLARALGPRGHGAAPWSVRPESQDVEVACLGAVAGNRTWEERIVKALMSGFPTSAPPGWKEQATHTHTHTHTHTPLSNNWQGLEARASFHRVNSNTERQADEEPNQGFCQLVWQTCCF